MRKYIVIAASALMAAGGGAALYLSILAFLHERHEQQENRFIQAAIGAPVVNPDLPMVLIIGDSISVPYTVPVRLRLEGIANIFHPMENCGGTLKILQKLDGWLGSTKWAVIHFNAGLHDLAHVQYENVAPGKQKMVPVGQGPRWVSPESYRANLEEIVERLKKTGARLIFATTTPVPVGEANRLPEDVALYNQAALSVMRKNNVQIDDLNAVSVESAGLFQMPRDVHFLQQGSDILADRVAASIKTALPSKLLP
ncbi:SGNH/GDSL hydrolase family protein [Beijerinckiaceae bacterium]|nr:SGNH/GDSL hydrolase family protein [Beijerinckiaceae bacterium]